MHMVKNPEHQTMSKMYVEHPYPILTSQIHACHPNNYKAEESKMQYWLVKALLQIRLYETLFENHSSVTCLPNFGTEKICLVVVRVQVLFINASYFTE